MRPLLPSLALLSAVLLASPASADVSGPWRVTGTLGGVAFALDCKFQPQGGALGGECTEVSGGDSKVQAGTVHPLTKGSINGAQVSWTYQASFLVAHFDVNYTGAISGGHITGTVDASGQKGDFTAVPK